MPAMLVGAVMAAMLLAGQASDVAMKTFRDAALAFSYDYPGYFEVRPSEHALDPARDSESDAGAKHRLSCMAMPLDARHTTETEHDLIAIYTFDFACMGKVVDVSSMETVVLGEMARSLKTYGGTPQTGAVKRYELDGYTAAYVETSVDAPSVRVGMTLYSGSTCMLRGQTVLCWSAMSADRAKLHRLLANAVVFDGKEPVALVPKDVLGE